MALSAVPLVMEAANLTCGVGGANNHLRLTDVRLPSIEEQYIDHRPGGAPMAIEVDVMLNKLQCDFTIAGWSGQIDSLVRAWSQNANIFTFFGAMRDRGTGGVIQSVAAMTGRLGKASHDPWRRGSLSQSSYSIRGIITYELVIGGRPIFAWDFFNNSISTPDYSTFVS